jgi:hypothetical protein
MSFMRNLVIIFLIVILFFSDKSFGAGESFVALHSDFSFPITQLNRTDVKVIYSETYQPVYLDDFF